VKRTTLITRARDFAEKAHEHQLYDNGRPFIYHPAEVADLISTITYGKDEHLIAAAWLHDTIEDTPTTYEQLYDTFGPDVADLVREVTKAGGKDHKGYYFPNLHTRRAIMLKFADRLANISNMQTWEPDRVEHYLKKSRFWKSEI